MKTPIPSILNEAMIEVAGFLPEAAVKDNSKISKRILMVSISILFLDLKYKFSEIASMFDLKYHSVYGQFKQAEKKLMYDRPTIEMYEQCKKFIENQSRSPKRDTGRDVRGGRVERSFLREEAILKSNSSQNAPKSKILRNQNLDI